MLAVIKERSAWTEESCRFSAHRIRCGVLLAEAHFNPFQRHARSFDPMTKDCENAR